MKLRNKLASLFFAAAAPLCFAAAALLCFAPARAMETDCVIHDPSTVVKSGATYWVFGTGTGVSVYSSTDRRHWTREPPVFAAAPAWTLTAVPGNTQRSYWAPDIRCVAGKYLLYYSVSTFGSNTSAIGLATSPTLQPPHWTDQGMVIQSSRQNDFNTIDPCITSDTHGGLWLSFGSFWSGIKMVPLDPKTGKPASTHPPIYSIAAHPQDRADSIEASCISTHSGYYYLFADWGYCCRGPQSTYNIVAGRSRSITGPYLDRAGHDMRSGGGTPFLPAIRSDSQGTVDVGPGHAGLLSDTDGEWFTFYYEWARDHDGRPMLNLQKLTWGKDGWPALTP